MVRSLDDHRTGHLHDNPDGRGTPVTSGTGKLETTYGTGAGFIYTDDTCTGANLAPGKSCSITVTLAATAVTSYVDGGLIVRGRIHKGWNPLARIVLAGRPA